MRPGPKIKQYSAEFLAKIVALIDEDKLTLSGVCKRLHTGHDTLQRNMCIYYGLKEWEEITNKYRS